MKQDISKEQYVTYQEITTQGDTLNAILSRIDAFPLDRSQFQRFIFTGCGSSFFLSRLIAQVWTVRLALPCQAAPASEIVLYPEAYFERNASTAVFVLSRTGSTAESVRAGRLALEYGFSVIPVTCYEGSEITTLGPTALVFPEVQEKSVVMTRAFTGILGAFLKWGHPEPGFSGVPARIRENLQHYENEIDNLAAEPFHNIVFLGTGSFQHLAWEAMLKVKEMTGSPTEAWQSLEFLHGPKAIVDAETLVWLFAGRKDSPYLHDLIEALTGLGARICVTGNQVPEELCRRAHRSFVVDWPVERDETEALGLLHLPHLYAFFRAMRLGKNPDQPEKLSRVVKLTTL